MFVIFVQLVFGQIVSGGLQKSWNLTDKFGAVILKAHNDYRFAESKNIEYMAWDTVVADTAQDWADKCYFAHSGTPDSGENLAANSIYQLSSTNPIATDEEMQRGIAKAVDQWMKEKSNYAYTSNSCSTAKVCGHYTQVVWRNSVKLGCGVAQCDNVLRGFSSFYVVCQYTPPGNYIGERPY